MKKFAVIIQGGYRFLKRSPGIVILYVTLSFLTQTLLPVAWIPNLLAEVTNGVAFQFPSERRAKSDISNHEHNDGASIHDSAATHLSVGPSVVRPYLEWLFLVVALIPLNIWFRLTQCDLDSGMELEMRKRIFANVLRQPPEFFQKHNPGHLADTVTQMVTQAQQAFRALSIEPVMQLVSLSIAMYMIIVDLRSMSDSVVWMTLAAIVLIGFSTVYIVQSRSTNAVGNCQAELQKQMLEVAGLATSVVSAPQDIQAMGAEDLFTSQYDKAIATLFNRKRNQVSTMEMVNSLLGFPTQMVLACLFGFVVYAVTSGKTGAAPGSIVALSYLVPRLMEPFKTFSALGLTATSSWPAVDLFLRLSNQPSRILNLPGAIDVDRLEPTIEAKNLTFKYDSHGTNIFKDASFEIPAGSITGLVARFGQGKTTFFRLVLRFYDPQQGEIRLGGHPTTGLTLRSLRRQISMMSQSPTFFHLSLRENFKVAKPDATDEEIRRTAEKTGLWSILLKTYGPNPLDQPFAAGTALSGGQKRKFSLTLSLLRNSIFLLLDEPSANLSADELRDLISTIRTASVGKTVIVVDHLLPSLIVPLCDYVIVLEGGNVVQRGAPAQLLLEEGEFQELYRAQLPRSQQVNAG